MVISHVNKGFSFTVVSSGEHWCSGCSRLIQYRSTKSISHHLRLWSRVLLIIHSFLKSSTGSRKRYLGVLDVCDVAVGIQCCISHAVFSSSNKISSSCQCQVSPSISDSSLLLSVFFIWLGSVLPWFDFSPGFLSCSSCWFWISIGSVEYRTCLIYNHFFYPVSLLPL